jgi:hypothetical protein
MLCAILGWFPSLAADFWGPQVAEFDLGVADRTRVSAYLPLRPFCTRQALISAVYSAPSAGSPEMLCA